MPGTLQGIRNFNKTNGSIKLGPAWVDPVCFPCFFYHIKKQKASMLFLPAYISKTEFMGIKEAS